MEARTPIDLIAEAIMEEVRDRLPDIPTHEYNRTCEAVLHVLNELEARRVKSMKAAS